MFPVGPTEYIGKKVLAVQRCCQERKGTQDLGLVNAFHGRNKLKTQKEWKEEMKIKGRE